MNERKRAARGAALLDRIRPKWFKRIALTKLDLSSETRCVLGLLYGDFSAGTEQMVTLVDGEWLEDKLAAASKHGMVHSRYLANVDPDEYDEEYAALTQAWREEVLRRKAAAGDGAA